MTLTNPIVVLIDTKAYTFNDIKHLAKYTDNYIQKRLTNVSDDQIKVNSVLGCLLRKYLIRKTFNIPYSQQEIVKENQGKPVLKGYPNIHFNVSHAEHYIVCILYDKPVGIDIQPIMKYNPKVAEYIFTKHEQDQVAKSINQDFSYTDIWTKKESIAKAIGCGIAYLGKADIKNISTKHIVINDIIINYSILNEN